MDDVSVTGITEGSNLDESAVDTSAVPRSEVTEIIKREKAAAYRKAQREYQAELEALKTGQTQGLGGMTSSPSLNKEELYKEFRANLENELKESQEQQQRESFEKYVGDQANIYLNKMHQASLKPDLAQDFREMTSRFKPEAFQEIFYLANSLENTPDIIYDLMANPTKLSTLDYLAKRDPDLAMTELRNLSNSIQTNQQAKMNNVAPNAPLSRQQPSIVAGQDNGEMSLEDYKKASWLRV